MKFGSRVTDDLVMGLLQDSRQGLETLAPAPIEQAGSADDGFTPSLPVSGSQKGGRKLAALFLFNLAVILAQFASHTTAHSWASVHGVTTAFGQLSGLMASYLILVQILFIARVPKLDRMAGSDQLLRWHKQLGRLTFTFLVMHVAFIIAGYSDGLSVWHTTSELVLRTEHILKAVVSFALICMIAATSIRAARKRVKYETWYFVHLYTYLAIGLAIPHQIFVGRDFVGHLGTQLYWGALYIGVASALVYFRVFVPWFRSLRHNLRVSKIVQENHETVSVYITGRNLTAIPAEAGQYINLRFLNKDAWFQSHPYSLSAAPNGEFLRITVKAVGDGTKSLAHLVAGTRVIAEGPFGNFTNSVRTHRNVVLIAGGIGITPVRALAEALPAGKGDITLIYRARTEANLVFEQELRDLAQKRGINLQHVIGSRSAFLQDSPPLGPRQLLVLAPHIAESDVFVCGPKEMMDTVRDSVRELGLKSSQVHYEEFSY